MGLYATLPVIRVKFLGLGGDTDIPSDMHAALTLVLGWLLVFRTNTSYARWWEARTLWGTLVNISRNMAIKVADLVKADDKELIKFQTEIVAYAYGLKDHLRDEAVLQNLAGFEDCQDQPGHLPSYLVTRMYEELGSWRDDGFIDSMVLRVLDEEARRFLEICGGCERIKNTRLALSYRIFARQCVFLFLATFPWGIVHSFHAWTIPLTVIVSYFMLGLETVAEHVEEPFGHDVDDLDLDELCETIETTVSEIFQRRLSRNDDTIVVQ
jgi:putative membrane protein